VIALIDMDIVAFATSASAENEEFWVAQTRADNMIQNILQATGSASFEGYLTGEGNFRYLVYPEYKANRLDTYRPKWEKELKDYLVLSNAAIRVDGIEADDMLGIRQTELSSEGQESIICSIDKDLKQIPGWHYSWPIIRKDVVVSEEKTFFVSQSEADYFFYYQLLVGDPTDNIKGARGVGKVKAKKLLDCDPSLYFETVREAYQNDLELEMNAKCIWIMRERDKQWEWPIEASKQQE
jgi:5'-3' exonuclease